MAKSFSLLNKAEADSPVRLGNGAIINLNTDLMKQDDKLWVILAGYL